MEGRYLVMLETRTVSGTIHKATGDVWPFAEVTFKLRQNAGAGGIVVPQFPEVVTADEDGHFECELYTVTDSFLPYRCTLPNGRGFKFDLPPGDEITLDVLQDLGPLEDEDSVSAALINAITLALVWSNITGKPSTFPPATHNHDDRYLTESETTALITNLVAGAPGALDTLNELAAALGDDANFASTITNLIGTKQSLSEKGEADGYVGLNSDNAIPRIHLGHELRDNSIVQERLSANPEQSVAIDSDGVLVFNKLDEQSGHCSIDSYNNEILSGIRSDEQPFNNGDTLWIRNNASADLYLRNSDPAGGKALFWESSMTKQTFARGAWMVAKYDSSNDRFTVLSVDATPAAKWASQITGSFTIDDTNWHLYIGRVITVNPDGGANINFNNLPDGFHCTLFQRGGSDDVVIASGSYSIRNRQNHTKIAGELGVVGIIVETGNGELVLFGDTKA